MRHGSASGQRVSGALWVASFLGALLGAAASASWAAGAGPGATAGIGGVDKMAGQVLIVRGQKDVITPAVEAGKVQRGGLVSGDQVMTVKDGAATIALLDGSELTVEDAGYVSVEERSPLPDEEGLPKAISKVRVVTVMTGKLLWQIAKSATTLTKFELPTGVIQVTGTTGLFTVQSNFGQVTATAYVFTGQVDFNGAFGEHMYGQGTLSAGQALTMTYENGKMYFTAPTTMPDGQAITQPVVITLPNGIEVVVDPGESVAISYMPDGRILVEAVTGDIEIRVPGQAPFLLMQGRSLTTPPPLGMAGRRPPGWAPGAGPPGWPNFRRRPASPSELQ